MAGVYGSTWVENIAHSWWIVDIKKKQFSSEYWQHTCYPCVHVICCLVSNSSMEIIP